MKILYITAEVPFPLTSGLLRHYHFMKGLTQAGHAVTCVSLTRRRLTEEVQHQMALVTRDLHVFGLPGSGQGRGMWPRMKTAVEYRRSARKMATEVIACRQQTADIIILSGKDTAAAISASELRVPVVVDFCDSSSARVRAQMRSGRMADRIWSAARLVEVSRIEQRVAAQHRNLVFASERDRSATMAPSTTNCMVIPNGVDCDFWRPRTRQRHGKTIGLSGVFSYLPNHDAALRLIEEIAPRLRSRHPDLRVLLMGKDPSPQMKRWAATTPGVIVTGEVSDLRPWLEQVDVYVAPLRYASGIQNKVLEAMAMELPVVTTPTVVAGSSSNGSSPPVNTAETPQEIADAADRLLCDPGESNDLGRRSRDFVERSFSWHASVARLEAACHQAMSAHKNGEPECLVLR